MTNASKASESKTSFSLLLLLVSALSRHKLLLMTYLLVLLSALSVVLSAHENRQQNIALERLMQEKDNLDVEWRNLILEQRALTEHNRIEAFVAKELDMRRPSVKDEVVVRIK